MKRKMTHGVGVRKVPKKCHVLFEWPLNGSHNQQGKISLFDLQNEFIELAPRAQIISCLLQSKL
jgi:hypothetical protein